MQNKFRILFLIIAVLFILSTGILPVSAQAEGKGQICLHEKLSPGLQTRIQDRFSNQPVRVIIQFKKQEKDRSGAKSKSMSRAEKLARLKQQADCFRQGLMQFMQKHNLCRLRGPKKVQREGNINPLWIGNCVAANLLPETIEKIASRPEVNKIVENNIVSIPSSADEMEDEVPLDLWNLDAIGLGETDMPDLDGSGVRLGIIDTGINLTNPDLAGKLAAWAEFDHYGMRVESEPHETHYRGHGTQVASIMVGDRTGVAPGASILCALALPEGSGTLEQTLAAMQWIIDPDNNPETDDGAQVVNMSWGMMGTSPVYQTAIANMIAAGVLPVCAIGNMGPGYTLSPGNVPDAVGVGAVDSHDRVTSFSSGAEVCWNERCVTKPDIAAPGSSVWGIGADGEYQTMAGTSVAAPHVSAAAALLLEYRHDLRPAQLKRFLLNTSFDLGPEGRDDLYGKGRLDIPEAFAFLDSYSNRLFSIDLVYELVETTRYFKYSQYVTHFSDGTTWNTGETSYTPAYLDADIKPVGMADVNGDGFSDLVLRKSSVQAMSGSSSSYFTDSYLVYLSGDEGGFSESPVTWISSISTKATAVKVVGLADVNGDKRADVVIQETIDQPYYTELRFRVLLSKRGDYFEMVSSNWANLLVSDYYKYEFMLGDVNGDGKADLVTAIRYASQSHSPVTIAVGQSDGTSFQTPMPVWLSIPPSWVRGPMNVTALSDVDGDGLDDLVLQADGYGNTAVYVYGSNGSDRFVDGHAWCYIATGANGGIQGVADVDGDGAADLIVDPDRYSVFAKELTVWLSDGQKRFYESSGQWFYKPVSEGRTVNFIGFENTGLGNWNFSK